MSAGWVAASVRARVMARRRIGAAECRRVATCGSLADAVPMLDATSYRIAPGLREQESGDRRQQLGAAQHAIARGLLWDLRVLAGWLPQGGTPVIRALAGWFEIANVSQRLLELEGRRPGPYFDLGALATAWPQLRLASSPSDIRATLAASAWNDPGGDTAAAIQVGLRARWAQRVASLGEPTRTWAAAAIALLTVGERSSADRPDNPVLMSVASALLGPAAAAATAGELAAALPGRLAWALKPGTSASDLWRCEAGWWARMEQDGYSLLTGSGFDHKPVIGAAVLLAADARRLCSALEIAARDGSGIEVFDAVA
jgi:hypothetical protein